MFKPTLKSNSSFTNYFLIFPLEFNSKVIKGLSPGGVFLYYLYVCKKLGERSSEMTIKGTLPRLGI